ncbi:uncharacterized protein RHOBADRAFT_42880 [Rhodotorula graminis WP1]|uniref:Uncharacterized protein n=1 Tax=Rhodotorula graminis (strain WP1) TaxID=578459 RepID=A0A194S7H2_RHOGW|nr:uncharacterized protein RHOBADRAFT_42880 [Rhodotorula graminis WP1]KPV76537.1 hypothetical protein RHOBADRAFT_42880 [Rhodotorula graminis WP1]
MPRTSSRPSSSHADHDVPAARHGRHDDAPDGHPSSEDGDFSPRTRALREHFAEQGYRGHEAGRWDASDSSEDERRRARWAGGSVRATNGETVGRNRRPPATAGQQRLAQLRFRRRDAMVGDQGEPSSPPRARHDDPRDLAFLPSDAVEMEEPLPPYERGSRATTPTSPCPSYASDVPPYSPGSGRWAHRQIRRSGHSLALS